MGTRRLPLQRELATPPLIEENPVVERVMRLSESDPTPTESESFHLTEDELKEIGCYGFSNEHRPYPTQIRGMSSVWNANDDYILIRVVLLPGTPLEPDLHGGWRIILILLDRSKECGINVVGCEISVRTQVSSIEHRKDGNKPNWYRWTSQAGIGK